MTKLIVPPELGFSLLELTISGALVAGLGLAGASFYKSRRQTQDYLNKLRELNEFHSNLTKLMQNSANCNANFNQWFNTSQVPGTASQDIKSIFLCNGACPDNSTAQASSAPRLTPPLLTEAMANPNDNTNWLPINLRNLAQRQRSWQVKDIGMKPLTKTGKGQINLLYELYPGRTDSKRVVKTITVNFKFNSNGRFMSCGSDKESNIRSAVQEMCEGLNAVMSTPTGYMRFATWDDTTLTCKLPGSNCSTLYPSAHYGQTGINNNGFIKCESYTKNVEAATLYNADDVDCTGGKVPSIQIGSDGQFRITCS